MEEVGVIWGDTGEIGDIWGDTGDMGGHEGFGNMGRALGTLGRLWGLRGGHTDFGGALGTLGRPLGILGRHWGVWGALGTWGVQPPPTSAFTLWISFSSSSGIIFPLRGKDRDGDGDTERPPRPGAPRDPAAPTSRLSAPGEHCLCQFPAKQLLFGWNNGSGQENRTRIGGTPGNRFWVTSGTRLGVIPSARFWGDLSDQVLG